MLFGQVTFPGLWRVVMHSQYLSMKGMMSCSEKEKVINKEVKRWSPQSRNEKNEIFSIVMGDNTKCECSIFSRESSTESFWFLIWLYINIKEYY